MSPIGINLEPLPPFSPCVDIDGYERLPALISHAASNGQAASSGGASLRQASTQAAEPQDRGSRPPLETPARRQARSASPERKPAAAPAAAAAASAPTVDETTSAARYGEAGQWSQAPVPRAVTTAPVSVEAASGTLVLPGDERAAASPPAPAPAETSLALAVQSSHVEMRIICVALNFGGRKKMVRHLESTYVGQLAELHLGHQNVDKRKPTVVTDSEGFEVGKELTLGVIARTVGERDGILELTMKVDEW